MDRNLILEAAYETIKDSLEWGIDCEDKTFGNFIDGIINMSEVMFKKIDQVNCDKCKCDCDRN